jgi:hypothetical protein
MGDNVPVRFEQSAPHMNVFPGPLFDKSVIQENIHEAASPNQNTIRF